MSKYIKDISSVQLVFDLKASEVSGKLLFKDNEGGVYQDINVTIKNGEIFTFTFPQNIPKGSGYTLEFIPSDTLLYNKVVSDSFSIGDGTAIEEVNAVSAFSIYGNTLVSLCKGAKLFNMLGQQMRGDLSSGISLNFGVYFFQCDKNYQKILIK